MLTALQIAEELFNERRAVERAAQEDPRQEPVAARCPGARSACMSAGLAAEKSALRQAMRAAREALDAEQRVSRTVAAVERLLELPAFARAARGARDRRVCRRRRRAEPGGRAGVRARPGRHRRAAARERHAAAPALSRAWRPDIAVADGALRSDRAARDARRRSARARWRR